MTQIIVEAERLKWDMLHIIRRNNCEIRCVKWSEKSLPIFCVCSHLVQKPVASLEICESMRMQ